MTRPEAANISDALARLHDLGVIGEWTARPHGHPLGAYRTYTFAPLGHSMWTITTAEVEAFIVGATAALAAAKMREGDGPPA
jgi:hypothetical protein